MQRDGVNLRHVYRVTCSGGVGSRMDLRMAWNSRGAKTEELDQLLNPGSGFYRFCDLD